MAIKAKKTNEMVDESDEDGEKVVKERIREASRSRSKGYQRPFSEIEKKGKKVIEKLSKKWRTMDKKVQEKI